MQTVKKQKTLKNNGSQPITFNEVPMHLETFMDESQTFNHGDQLTFTNLAKVEQDKQSDSDGDDKDSLNQDIFPRSTKSMLATGETTIISF